MLIDRERSFNPLQADRVRQFDAAHAGPNGPVRHETGWLIFEDGSNRDSHGDVLEDATVMKPADRRKWRTYWHRQMIQSIAEQFRRERANALQTLDEQDEQKVQKLHDRLVELKKALDKIESEAIAPPTNQQVLMHGARGQQAMDAYWWLDRMRTNLTQEKHRLEQAKHKLRFALPADVQDAESCVENLERSVAWRQSLVNEQLEWMNLPYAEREKINKELAEDKRQRSRAEYEPLKQRRRRLNSLSLGFVEDDPDMQSPSQRRASEEREHDDAVRAEGAAFLAPRMAEREQRLERARNTDVEQAARSEFEEASQAGAELAKPAKKRGRPPKAKR